jgi:ABC-type nitrate/sulfonate/bicarbonate transport system substrate-binding protein
METEDILELGIIAVVLIAIGWILYQALGFFQNSGVTDTLSAAGGGAAQVLNAGAGAVQTLTGGGDTAPGSNNNLFYSGVENFFSTGSIYGDSSTR